MNSISDPIGDARELRELSGEFVREFLALGRENPRRFASICLLGSSEPTLECVARNMRMMLADRRCPEVRVEIKGERPGKEADAYWIDVEYFMDHLNAVPTNKP